MAMDSLFDRMRATARQLGASDIHLKPGMEPILRIDGELRTLRNPDVPAMSRDFLHNLAMSLLNDRRRDMLERLGRRDRRADDIQRNAAAGPRRPAPRRCDDFVAPGRRPRRRRSTAWDCRPARATC